MATDVLRTLRTPSASRLRSFHLNFFSEPTSKSTRRDTTAREFIVCMKVWTIPWSVAARLNAMTTRSHSKSVVFSHSFELKGVDRILPPGEYRIVTDEELIEELSFPVYRRVATMIFVPAASHNASTVEMVAIDPQELHAAQERDLNYDA